MNRISVLTSYRRPDVIDTATVTSWLYTIRSDDNPNKELVLSARSDLENKNSYKEKMLCVTPHATFQVRGVTNNFSSLSSHILIDLDGSDIPNVINYKSSLADVEYVRAVWTSASGNGLALLVEADTITTQNFKATMNSLHEYFKQMGLRPDPKMKSIASKNVISYDPEIILKKTWKKFKAVENVSKEYNQETYIAKKETILQEHPLETAIRLAGENAAKKHHPLLFKTKENFADGSDFHVYEKGRDWHRVFYSPSIPDGSRHHVIKMTGLTLVHLNPDIAQEVLTAFMTSVNKRCFPPLTPSDLRALIQWVWNKKVNNEIEIMPSKKYIVFNDTAGIPLREKQKISGREMGKIRSGRTRELIQEAINNLTLLTGKRPTQKEVAIKTGKSVRTIKRYWEGDV